MKIKIDFYTLIPFDNVLYIESYGSWDERVAKAFEDPTDAEEWLSSFGYTKTVNFHGEELCSEKKA